MAKRRASAEPPSIVYHASDAALLEVLRLRLEPPLGLSAASTFKAVFALKRWVAAVRTKLAANPSAGSKKKKKKKEPSAQVVLKERLHLADLRMLSIAGDGNCQFRAVSQQLFGSEEYHMHVRQKAMAYMRSKREEFACFYADGVAFDRYLQKMERDRSWGDELTLRAICSAFGATIHVVTSTEHNWYLKYTPDEPLTQKQAFLAYVAPVHYNAFTAQPPANKKARTT